MMKCTHSRADIVPSPAVRPFVTHLDHCVEDDVVFPAAGDDLHLALAGPVGVVDGLVVGRRVAAPLPGAEVEPAPLVPRNLHKTGGFTDEKLRVLFNKTWMTCSTRNYGLTPVLNAAV